MSSSGTATVSPQEPPAFKRAVRKIKCAAMVASLAKSWQGWANEHTDKQDNIPSGWMPSSVEEDDKRERNHVVKLSVTPRVITVDDADNSENKIRTVSVTKTVQPKRSECSSSDLVNAIRGKMESGPEESKPFLGNESPTRRRHMRALQGGGGVLQDKKLMLQEKKMGSRSSSLDTEDSGLGEEAGLSDNSESKSEQSGNILLKKQNNRPKISDKVVGILLRCRKHKMLDFEGEMLWKGQDDHVIITLRD
eukprot:superscaffoldBa00002613_g14794